MSVDMNKTIAEASLDNLHDIMVPEAVGFFPPAPGWIIVLLLLLALLFHFAVHKYKHYKKSQYRREALKELVVYKKNTKASAIALLLLAKRVGITMYGRKEVAKFTGDSWWDFMEQHSKAKVTTQMRQEIAKLLYDESFIMNDALHTDITHFVTVWIKTHRMDKDV
jgi:hypothetical protein